MQDEFPSTNGQPLGNARGGQRASIRRRRAARSRRRRSGASSLIMGDAAAPAEGMKYALIDRARPSQLSDHLFPLSRVFLSVGSRPLNRSRRADHLTGFRRPRTRRTISSSRDSYLDNMAGFGLTKVSLLVTSACVVFLCIWCSEKFFPTSLAR